MNMSKLNVAMVLFKKKIKNEAMVLSTYVTSYNKLIIYAYVWPKCLVCQVNGRAPTLKYLKLKVSMKCSWEYSYAYKWGASGIN